MSTAPIGDYEIAGLKLVIDSPAIEGVSATATTAVNGVIDPLVTTLTGSGPNSVVGRLTAALPALSLGVVGAVRARRQPVRCARPAHRSRRPAARRRLADRDRPRHRGDHRRHPGAARRERARPQQPRPEHRDPVGRGAGIDHRRSREPSRRPRRRHRGGGEQCGARCPGHARSQRGRAGARQRRHDSRGRHASPS